MTNQVRVIIVKMQRALLRSLAKAVRSTSINTVIALILAISAPFAALATGTSNGITGPVNADFRAGMWWDPALSGSGWDINQGGDVVFGIWYTYNEDGSPVWYTTNGAVSDGRFEGDLLYFTWDYNGGKVNAPVIVGSVSFHFLNPQLADIHWQLGDKQNSHTLRPFIFAEAPALTDYSGSWYDPRESGYGMTIQTQGDLTYGVLYYYDEAGKPRWSAGVSAKGGQSLSMLDFEGACPWCAYHPPEHIPAGELIPEFDSESALRLDMNLPQAGPFWAKSQVQHVMISNPPSGRVHPAALAHIASEDALVYYFKTGYLTGNGRYPPNICLLPPIVSPAPPAESLPNSAILSSTNVQVEGVDEADVVKATADYLYSLDHPTGEIPLSEDGVAHLQSITRYRISANGDIPSGDGAYALALPNNPETGSYLGSQGLYYYSGEPGSDSSALVYLASQVEGGCFQATTRATFINAFELGTDADNVVDTQLKIDGGLIASRKIGDRLFVAISFKPDIYALVKDTLGEDAAAQFSFTPAELDALFELVKPDQLFPTVTYADGSSRRLVSTGNVMMPPLPIHDIEPVLTTLSMFDLNDLDAPPVSIAIMGRTDGMYATPQSVYFASSRSGYGIDESGEIVRNGFVDTDIHKIAISRDSLEYRGSGTIEGTLDNDPERLAFRMSEYQDHLRVVSSRNWRDRWGDLGDHRLTILKESGNDEFLLKTVSVLPNAQRPEVIGKPGEAIHGVRFQGERGYVVTFIRVDPLYALDLSDPADPRILGELEIEGFSDYLHPVGDHLLIGVGMQAVTPPGSNNAWFQGVQVGLFDVSAPADPVLLDLHEIGYRGTSSAVLDTHRAFTFLPGDPEADEPMRFIVPVVEHAPPDGIPSPDPTHWYPWQSTGIAMFEVNERDAGFSTLEQVGRADLASTQTVDEELAWFYQRSRQEYSRSTIYGDQVFHYYRGGLFMTQWAGSGFVPADNCPLCEPASR